MKNSIIRLNTTGTKLDQVNLNELLTNNPDLIIVIDDVLRIDIESFTNRRDQVKLKEPPTNNPNLITVIEGGVLRIDNGVATIESLNVNESEHVALMYGELITISSGLNFTDDTLDSSATPTLKPDTNATFPSSQTDAIVFNTLPTNCVTSVNISGNGVLKINGETIGSESMVVDVTGNNTNTDQD